MKVVCGVLIENDTVLIGKRKSTNQHYPSKWEFPGGKIEEGEEMGVCTCGDETRCMRCKRVRM